MISESEIEAFAEQIANMLTTADDGRLERKLSAKLPKLRNGATSPEQEYERDDQMSIVIKRVNEKMRDRSDKERAVARAMARKELRARWAALAITQEPEALPPHMKRMTPGDHDDLGAKRAAYIGEVRSRLDERQREIELNYLIRAFGLARDRKLTSRG
jgi:hypothetical protein